MSVDVKISMWIGSSFGIGFLPFGCGNWAVMFGLMCSFLLGQLNNYFSAFVISVLFLLGCLVTDRLPKDDAGDEPGWVVIDDVFGVMLAVFMIPLTSWKLAITAFFLFRAVDMFKFWPANVLEHHRVYNGVMLDDLIAGLYTNIILHVSLMILGGG